MGTPERVFVGLGANLGNPRAALAAAFDDLAALPSTTLLARSGLYRSAPVDALGPDFLNAVAELRTGMEPLALLRAMRAIERRHGRQRSHRNAPRTLDLDLLIFGTRHIDTPELVLPHPRLCERAFALAPMADLAPDLELGGVALREWLARAAGQRVERLEEEPGP